MPLLLVDNVLKMTIVKGGKREKKSIAIQLKPLINVDNYQ